MDMKEYMKRKRWIMIKGAIYSLACVMVFILTLLIIIRNISLNDYLLQLITGIGVILIMIPFLNWMSKEITKLTLEKIKIGGK